MGNRKTTSSQPTPKKPSDKPWFEASETKRKGEWCGCSKVNGYHSKLACGG